MLTPPPPIQSNPILAPCLGVVVVVVVVVVCRRSPLSLRYIANLFPGPSDPFVTSTELLCQQLNWHYEDLDPHCDKERLDKSKKK